MKTMTDRERRAYNRGLEDAAKEAEFYAHENFSMADDTVKSDPILSRSGPYNPTVAEFKMSEQLGLLGAGHASAGHAGMNIAVNIRERKVRR